MGENPFEGNVKLYYGDSLVELPDIVEGATFDIGDEECIKRKMVLFLQNDKYQKKSLSNNLVTIYFYANG